MGEAAVAPENGKATAAWRKRRACEPAPLAARQSPSATASGHLCSGPGASAGAGSSPTTSDRLERGRGWRRLHAASRRGVGKAEPVLRLPVNACLGSQVRGCAIPFHLSSAMLFSISQRMCLLYKSPPLPHREEPVPAWQGMFLLKVFYLIPTNTAPDAKTIPPCRVLVAMLKLVLSHPNTGVLRVARLPPPLCFPGGGAVSEPGLPEAGGQRAGQQASRSYRTGRAFTGLMGTAQPSSSRCRQPGPVHPTHQAGLQKGSALPHPAALSVGEPTPQPMDC